MSNIKLLGLAAEGFGSLIKPIHFELERGGIWFIKGANGAGKTSLFSALCWVLYKTNLKGVINEKIPTKVAYRPKDFRGTRVVVEFIKDAHIYMVARHIRFKGKTKGIKGENTLMIYRMPLEDDRAFAPEDLLGEEHYKDDQQGYLERLIGLDSQAFLSSILFGQKMKRLIESDNETKRKLFENLFDLDFIASARKKANNQFNVIDREVVKLTTNLQFIEGEVSRLETQYDEARDHNKEVQDDHDDTGEELVEVLDEHLLEIQSIEGSISTYTAQTKNFNDEGLKTLKGEIADITKNKQSQEEKISRFKVTFNETVAEKYSGKQEKLEKSISTIKITNSAEIEKVENIIEGLTTAYKQQKTFLTQNEDSLKYLKESSVDYADSIETSKAKIVKLNSDIAGIETECPSCGSPVKPEKVAEVKSKLADQITAENNAIKSLQLEMESLVAPLAEQENKVETATTTLEETKNSILVERTKLEDLRKTNPELVKLEDDYKTMLLEKADDLVLETNRDYLILKERLDDLVLSQSQKESELNTLELASDNYQEAKQQLPILEEQLRNAIIQKGRMEAAINIHNSKVLKFVDDKKILAAITDKKAEMIDIAKETEGKKKELERYRWWIGIGLGAAGIKAYVFSAMLNELNMMTEKYSSRLGLRVKFSVDLSKVSKPFTTTCYIDNVETDYDELSGGERQRIDLIMALALHDVISRNSNINVLIFDESFEGLDEEGRSVIIDLIRQKAEDKTIFVISHAEVMEALGVKYINVTKIDRNTEVE